MVTAEMLSTVTARRKSHGNQILASEELGTRLCSPGGTLCYINPVRKVPWVSSLKSLTLLPGVLHRPRISNSPDELPHQHTLEQQSGMGWAGLLRIGLTHASAGSCTPAVGTCWARQWGHRLPFRHPSSEWGRGGDALEAQPEELCSV